MPYLVSVLIAAAVFCGFLALTAYEERRGRRFLAVLRYRLDAKVARSLFIIEHVDWGAFTAHLTRTSLETLAHDAAHGTLMLVRSFERFLTRAVRVLRTRRDGAMPLPGPGASRLAKGVTYLKQNLRRSRKAGMNDIVRREGSD